MQEMGGEKGLMASLSRSHPQKRPATFQLRQNYCILLCVDKKDLVAMNSELKANTITEDGWELVMDKKVSPDQQRRRTGSLLGSFEDGVDSAPPFKK